MQNDMRVKQRKKDESNESIELDTIHDLQTKITKLQAFKAYFDELYGTGLDIGNWHLNGELEPFDNFYESALQEMAGDTK